MESMRDRKGPITSSALNKMMKKFEVTDPLASIQRSGRPSTAAEVATTLEQRCNPCRRLLHMESAVLEKFRGRQECRTEVSGE
ncbi:hypothetical protein TNCT_154451 [Trichonephila clavata]|uniref:Uncharacterized protein n=1 Tax=Trichonephila clavata TaxID=2740835 RepID=A0A8X6J4N1_TRICU|nr:hypothetical protein TNCT_154451 [Trichonephila clavata]